MITMRKIVMRIFSVVFIIMLFSPLITVFSRADTAGSQGGVLKCSTNHQLIPQSGDVGGGNIHWRLKGEAARQFREALIESVGNDTLYPSIANGDDTLDVEELGLYVRAANILESYLQRGGELNNFRTGKSSYTYLNFTPKRDIESTESIRYYGVRVTRSSLNTDSISDDTSGLIGTTSQDTSSIHIHYKISFHSGPGSVEYDIELADERVMTALWHSLIMPVKRRLTTHASSADIDRLNDGIQLRHQDILVRDGEAQGIVLKNGVPMQEDHYSYDQSNNRVRVTENISTGDNVTALYAYGYRWEGSSELSHWSYVVGTNSFYQPDYDDGSLYIIRTPAGEALYYDVQFQGENSPETNIKWNDFKILENPQLLFVLIIVFAYLISKFPKIYFKDYRDTYPVAYQTRAEKSRGVHLLSTVGIILMFLFYFLPTIGPLFIRGIYLIVLGAGLSVISAVLAKTVYTRKKDQIPDSILEADTQTREKTTNQRSPTSRTRTVKRTVKKPKKKKKKGKKKNTKRIYCDWCGEFFSIHKDRNLLSVKCPECDERQKMLREGYNYLIFDEEGGKQAYSLMKEFLKEGQSGLIITSKFPSKVREKHRVRNADIKWLSDHSSDKYDVLDPKRIDFDVTRGITKYSNENERAVIFLDGLEYLIVENSFENVSKFIKKTTDTCSLNATTYLVYVNPESLSKAELSILKNEFDHTEDLRKPSKKGEKKAF